MNKVNEVSEDANGVRGGPRGNGGGGTRVKRLGVNYRKLSTLFRLPFGVRTHFISCTFWLVLGSVELVWVILPTEFDGTGPW